MLNPRLQKYADRIRELIRASGDLRKASISRTDYREFIVCVQNILVQTCGENSPHMEGYRQVFEEPHEGNVWKAQIADLAGVLRAALGDLEGGYLTSTQQLIAADIFDNILQQAKHLNESGYKDAAAVLGRTVIEDALRRLASNAGLDLNDARSRPKMASTLNDDLRQAGTYALLMSRQIQAWVDIGNAAAHGRFNEYSQEQVAQMLDGIESFLANYFTP